MSRKKAIKAGSVKVTLLADDRAIAEQYAPTGETVRSFVQRQPRNLGILNIATRVTFKFYLPKLELTYPLTVEGLINTAEKENARICAEEHLASRAHALPG